MMPRPPTSTLFPYTTLFRSAFTGAARARRLRHRQAAGAALSGEREAAGVFVRGRPHRAVLRDGEQIRSEEHTSELQSHVNLVCRLLLEKKKNITPSVLSVRS